MEGFTLFAMMRVGAGINVEHWMTDGLALDEMATLDGDVILFWRLA